MKFAYCPRCGRKAGTREVGDEGRMPYCEQCLVPLFDITQPSIIVLVVNEQGEAALLRQGYVSKDTYVCVAGHIKTGENAEDTAAREVQEELGLCPVRLEFIHSYYYKEKDMLMLGFVSYVKKQEMRLSGEVDQAEWFPLEEAADKTRKDSIARQLIQDYLARAERK